MRTIRGAAAALAVCAVVSACGVGQNDDQVTTTSPAAIEESGNPWGLPIEQRPPLFDPCAEIPIEAVEEGVGGPVAPSEQLHNHRPGELFSCGWKNDEVLVDLLSTWKSYQGYVGEPTGIIENLKEDHSGRLAVKITDRRNDPTTCRYLFFTELGTVAVSLSLTSTFNSFRGSRFTHVCVALDEFTDSIIEFLPKGDFR